MKKCKVCGKQSRLAKKHPAFPKYDIFKCMSGHGEFRYEGTELQLKGDPVFINKEKPSGKQKK